MIKSAENKNIAKNIFLFKHQRGIINTDFNKFYRENMALHMEKFKDVQEVIKDLTIINEKIEKLLDKLPTSDNIILAELDSLFNRLPRLLYAKTTIEKGSMLYEQAVGRAMSLKERYNYKLTHSGLRKMID